MKMRWLLRILHLGLGIVFILASATKLSAQSLFVNEVINYGLLPESLARIYGFALPWVELFTGVALIISVFTGIALVLSLLMALCFAIANIFVMAQGTGEECGNCFGQLIPLSLTTALVIDILMIPAAAILLVYRKRIASLRIGKLLFASLGFKIMGIQKSSTRSFVQVIILVVIVLAVGLPLSLAAKANPVYQKIDNALEQGKPVYLCFYMDGCNDCLEQEPILEDLEHFYGDIVSFIHVEYRRGGDTAVQFEVTRVPAMVLITGKNDEGYEVSQCYSGLTSKLKLQRGLYESPAAHTICEISGPIADFSASTAFGYVPIQVQFTNLSLADMAWAWDYEWGWDFNDDRVIDSNVSDPSYVFEKPGTYSVSLELTGPCGTSRITKQDYLLFVTQDDAILKGCQVDFSAEPLEVDNETPVHFSGEANGEIISWKWDFDGDGTADSTERNPVHTYKEFGFYTVSLTVKAAECENRVIKQDYIRVVGCPCG